MRRALLIVGFSAALLPFGAAPTFAQLPPGPGPQTSPAPSSDKGATLIDGVAARIEDDIITESEVQELAAFQKLVDGESKPRQELLRELIDQWMIRNEATATKYGQPSAAEVDRAYAEFVKQFPSQEEFKKRCAAAGLTEAAVRRMVAQQLFLSRFIDYRFRPSAQVTDQQVEAYYKDEFAPQLKARNQPVPPLDDVDDTIREVLIQRAINERATKWLDDSRDALQIDIMSQGSGS
ncbi:MAG: hypothetical protein WA197_05655 [Candidatus Acidiferrales bacterium]